MRDYGALVVGFDITFPEPDRNIRDLLAPIDLEKLDSSFTSTLEEIEPIIDSDQYFARVMQSGIDVVLTINFNPQSSAAYNDLPPSIVDISEEQAERITVQDMRGFTGNINILQDAALGNGSMNQAPDMDGIVRRVPLVIRYGSSLYPTLSLEMFRVYNFLEIYEVVTQAYGDLDVVTAVRVGRGVGAFEIPTDGFGQVTVPYVGPSSLGNNRDFPYVSATDVLRHNLSAEEQQALQNSLVLVGTSAPGLGDIRAMPLQQVYPGVEVHANMLNALLNSVTQIEVSSGETDTQSVFDSFLGAGDVVFPYRPDWESGALFFIIMVLGIAMSMSFPFMNAAVMAGTALTLVVGSVWVNFQLWANYKLDFSLVLLLLVLIMVTSVNLIYGFLAESQTRKTIKGMFDQYVPPAHIDSMLSDPDNYTFEGRARNSRYCSLTFEVSPPSPRP